MYEEVEKDHQEALTPRWVITPKICEGIHSVKARLCVRGFEEDQFFRTDSPACSKEGVRSVLATISAYKWPLKSLDVRTAFLQGKQMERTVYVIPPEEANTDKLWKLNKCVYGLADASRYWYLKVREEIDKLQGEVNCGDQGIFMFYENEILIGIIACFVDDMIHGGNQHFENMIIGSIKKRFIIGTENNGLFDFVGIGERQNSDMSITVNQSSYINTIQELTVDKTKDLDEPASAEEKRKPEHS